MTSRRLMQKIALTRTQSLVDHLYPQQNIQQRAKMSTTRPISVAILDDYLDTARAHFRHIDPAEVSITVFKDTLPAFDGEKTTPEEREALINRLKPFTIISALRERTPFPKELFQSLPNLKVLLATGTQFQTFDLKAAKELGIIVATAKGSGRSDRASKLDVRKGGKMIRDALQRKLPQVGRYSQLRCTGNHHTTQHTWALILGLASNITHDDASIKSGGWQTDLSTSMNGKTLGLVGLGRLGAAVARIGVLAWGMKVIAWSENLNQEKADKMAEAIGLPVENAEGEKTFKAVSKKDLFETADVVSVHYVLSDRSKGIIGKKELGTMKKTALFVNASRGPLVDEDALLETLTSGAIRGAALDVFDIEPLPKDSAWRTTKWGEDGASKVLLTPHTGYVEERTINNWYAEQAENLERYLDGKELLNLLN